jgi:hypothetical protein
MSHGSPDYSNVAKPELTKRIDDMGELAARTTDLISLERGGEVVFCESFEYGIGRWLPSLYGTGSLFGLSAGYYASKGFSARLVGGSDGAMQGTISTEIPFLNLSNFGFEARLKIGDQVQAIAFYIDVYDGTYVYTPKVYLWPGIKELWIVDEGGLIHTIAANVEIPPYAYAFSFIKLVVNYIDKKYIRLMFNDLSIGLTQYGVQKVVSSGSPRMVPIISILSNSGHNGEIYIDNVFVTRSEY